MIRIEHLRKTFWTADGRTVTALDDFSLAVEPGSLVVLMGPNGSGKTTLFRSLDGQLTPDSGLVIWDNTGRSVSALPDTVRSVRHVPQEPLELAFPDMTLAEHLLSVEVASHRPRFWKRGITKDRLDRYRAILEDYGVPNLAQAVEDPLKSQSVGWQQIFIVLLSALAGDLSDSPHREAGADLLLLDEPTSSLDEENAGLCLDLLRRLHREGRTIMLATHDVDLAMKMADRICVLRQGRLVADILRRDLNTMTADSLASIVAGAGNSK